MTGTRLPNGFECTRPELDALGYEHTPRGAYWLDSQGAWSVCTPNGRIGSIAKHTVVEHEDRTISVSPSILVYATDAPTRTAEERAAMQRKYGWTDDETAEALNGRPGWHGYLERGVWREC